MKRGSTGPRTRELKHAIEKYNAYIDFSLFMPLHEPYTTVDRGANQ